MSLTTPITHFDEIGEYHPLKHPVRGKLLEEVIPTVPGDLALIFHLYLPTNLSMSYQMHFFYHHNTHFDEIGEYHPLSIPTLEVPFCGKLLEEVVPTVPEDLPLIFHLYHPDYSINGLINVLHHYSTHFDKIGEYHPLSIPALEVPVHGKLLEEVIPTVPGDLPLIFHLYHPTTLSMSY